MPAHIISSQTKSKIKTKQNLEFIYFLTIVRISLDFPWMILFLSIVSLLNSVKHIGESKVPFQCFGSRKDLIQPRNLWDEWWLRSLEEKQTQARAKKSLPLSPGKRERMRALLDFTFCNNKDRFPELILELSAISPAAWSQGLQSQTAWVQSPTLCVTLENVCITVPQFPHL